MLEERPWFVRGQLFHLQRWTKDFRESDPISYLRVGVKIPRIPMQYRELNIWKTIAKPIDDLVMLDDPCINSLNGMAIRVLTEMDVYLPPPGGSCGERGERITKLPNL